MLVVEDGATQWHGLAQAEVDVLEGQPVEEVADQVRREVARARLRGDDPGLEPDQGIAAVGLEQAEEAARLEDAACLFEYRARLGDVMKQVADEDGPVAGVGERQPCAVRGVEAACL